MQVDPAYQEYPGDELYYPNNPVHQEPQAMSNTALTLDNLQEPEMRDLLTQIADAVVQRSGLKETVQRLTEKVEDLERQVEAERGVVRDLQAKIEAGPDYEQRIAELESGLASEQHTVEVLKRELEEARETARALIAEVSEWQGKHQEATRQVSEQGGIIEGYQSDLRSLRDEHSRVCQERHDLEQQASRAGTLEADLAHCRESRESWERHAREAWDKMHDQAERHERQDRAMAEVRALIEQAQAKLAA